MGPLETELRDELAKELLQTEGIPDVWLDAVESEDPETIARVLETDPMSPEAAERIRWVILHFCRETVFRLAREVDELRAARTEGNDLG